MTTYDPGDVAIVEDPGYGWLPMILIPESHGDCWHGVDTDGNFRCLAADAAGEVKPLIFIDPTGNDEGFEALRQKIAAQSRNFLTFDADDKGFARVLRAAFRDVLANGLLPVKPEMPKGLGAVVVEDGVRWIHTGSGVWTRNTAKGDTSFQTRVWSIFSNRVKIEVPA